MVDGAHEAIVFVQMLTHGHVSRCAAERVEDCQNMICFNALVLRSDETLIASFLQSSH